MHLGPYSEADRRSNSNDESSCFTASVYTEFGSRFQQTRHLFVLRNDLIVFELRDAEVNISIPYVEGREECHQSLTELSVCSAFLLMEAGADL